MNSVGYVGIDLGFADSEHLRAAARAYTLSCRLAILHSDAFGILHFLFSAALDAISLHYFASFFI
jgi:hypothetical protein